MDKIYNIKYVDAYYSYAKKLGETKLATHDAHGYVERSGSNIIIIFIKKRDSSNRETIEKKENIIKGLVIPETALLSVVNTYTSDILMNIVEGSTVKVEWRDVVYVANLPRYDCSVMYTEGILFKIEKDHIVLKNPETIRVNPSPLKNHPDGKSPTYLVIPVSFIADIAVVK